MVVEKLIRDGKVAVLYTPSFGCGFSTGLKAEDVYRKTCIFNPRVVLAVLGESTQSVNEVLRSEYPGIDLLCNGRELVVEWLEQGSRFIIQEHDGFETIVLLNEENYYTA